MIKIKAINGPCEGQIFQSVEENFSYKFGDILIMVRKRDFKINPFWEDVHDIMFPQHPINPITQECFKYVLLKNEKGELYLKYAP